ncbi:50S ribosomal protein L6 [Xylella fastidiosa subsp. morus]|jgi:large subunit ribosomal protein L6|uniref:Large ribosomal subunit protein uL6 n=3 Tax=Xylella fastidiosa TaxID=2371 RepID=RL6_XYLFT|nr:50S ribosomal protein L6 [Xylella fastidiosa]B2I8I4.1 RecName: Full=Large ribosomal subunit protein uL6; AltName: Full=50S ribosomal protein L6 [Xylella fastidiosa M23]Q87E67.1 RecName: Full=Large ribosomal subunit protein uL6; AltName: Full=50S ribosomal protein L6 [Xylella fastidiosa Temecula1]ADN63447.1 50S ribosomal protein L6 [Xylella fastidiosa subsp. fastidiosa GB514]AAO28331.1 50S ribosomal protein L6 [Xylella fastidiosa Temecula1]ACB91895.1 ribosomal protein L6 [Xylella fastidiosa 
MSRVAKKPISIPKGVEVSVQSDMLTVKGVKGVLTFPKSDNVNVVMDGDILTLSANDHSHVSLAGTVRAILSNMIKGVSIGFERKLELVGVGYRASMQGKDLNLSLGFSHPLLFVPPEGINLLTPSQTEVVVQGIDKQRVGEVAAKIRNFRPPEPYKGKGLKYATEAIMRKEAKKA